MRYHKTGIVIEVYRGRCGKIKYNILASLPNFIFYGNNTFSFDYNFQEGRIFIADYVNWTQGLPRNKRYQSDEVMHCADCLALFYAPGDCRFLPIAIQLKPDDENYIFTPHDKKYDWMLAKMFFRCSDTKAHQVNVNPI